MKNYYSVLGVQETAAQTEIKRAYRNLMRKWHPDVNRTKDATKRTEEVNVAYSVLSCPESRETHDIQLREAGLSSKLLYKKTAIPCLECNCKGSIKIYSNSRWQKLLRRLRFNVSYESKLCLNCCGSGWDYQIEEY